MTPASYLPPIPQPPNDPTTWLLNARTGWRMADTRTGVEERPLDGALALAPLAGTGRSMGEPGGSFGGLVLPTNVTRGADGILYLLDRSTLQLMRFDPCACGFVTVASVGGAGGAARQFDDPHGIAIYAGNLFICDTGHHRIAVFSMRQFAFRSNWMLPATLKLPNLWTPIAIAFDSIGRAWVTDPANGYLHRFDKFGAWQKSFPGFGSVKYIAIDRLGRIHLAIDGAPGIRTINGEGNLIRLSTEPVSRPDVLSAAFPDPPFHIDGQGNLHLAAWLPADCLPCAPATARRNPASEPGVFDLNGKLVAPAELLPPAGPIYPIPPDFGQCYSIPLDSALYRCQWHRVVLRGAVPKGTRLVVSTHTSEIPENLNEIQNLPDEAWQTNQAVNAIDPTTGEWDCLVRSGGGRYLTLRLDLHSNGTATPCLDSIVIEFPRISLRRYLPAVFGADPVSADFTDRFLSLFDTTFRSIEHTIDTQAKLFDPLATPAERDPKTGADFLSWLGSWIGLSIDRQWPEAQRRLLLRRAGALYDQRGTRLGLWKLLLLFLGLKLEEDCTVEAPCKGRCSKDCNWCCPPKATNCGPPPPKPRWMPPPLILEHYQLRRWLFLGQGRLGDEAVLWGKSIVNRSQLGSGARVGGTQLITTQDPERDPLHKYAYQFTIFVPARFGRDERLRKLLDNLLKSESPAQASYQVRYVEPRFRVGVQSTIGLDSVIGCAPEGVTLGQTPLNGSRVLAAPAAHQGETPIEVGASRIGGGMKLS